MTIRQSQPTRRHTLAGAGAGLIAFGLDGIHSAQAQAITIRQGYQTNIWGMPTYYLIKSGKLEKQGIKAEEFPVASGNLTMQQMVSRQVDLGTYAAQSLILGHDKGGLVGIAVLQYVGKTAAVIARKELGLTKIEQLKGLKVGNQVGASTGNIFTDTITQKAGLKKSDWQEVRLNVNEMVAALASKTIDAAAPVEPYISIAEADGIATVITDYSPYDRMPVFMAATPDFVAKNPDVIVSYLKAWLEVGRDFKDNPAKVTSDIHAFFTSKGYQMSLETFGKALAKVEVAPGFPDLKAYMQEQAEILLKEKKIAAIPDWAKLLRPDFMEKAMKG